MAIPSKYQLFYSPRSPFARRIRIAFARLGLSFEAREINVFEPPADLFAANPLGTVPALLVRGGVGKPEETFGIGDSSAILEYLHENYANRIWPADLAARARVRGASVQTVGIMTNAVAWFLENQRAQPDPEASAECLENIERALTAISAQSWKGLPWKVSDLQLTQAGYDLLVALEYLNVRVREYAWAPKFPELARFLEIHRPRQDLASSAPPA